MAWFCIIDDVVQNEFAIIVDWATMESVTDSSCDIFNSMRAYSEHCWETIRTSLRQEFEPQMENAPVELYTLAETNASDRLCTMTKYATIVIAEMAVQECREATHGSFTIDDMWAINHLTRKMDIQWEEASISLMDKLRAW